MPTQDDVPGYFNTQSNWGRWGDDDELGTLNHIIDGVRLAAARAVRRARSGGSGDHSPPGAVEFRGQPTQLGAFAASGLVLGADSRRDGAAGGHNQT